MSKIRQVTAKEIAALIGVSRQAVSAVLSGKSTKCVIPATREKILKTAQKLGYRANSAALKLAGHKTRRIGIIIAGYGFALGFPYMLADEVVKRGYKPILRIAQNPENAKDVVRDLVADGIDGLFIGTQIALRHADLRIPMVKYEFENRDIGMNFERVGMLAAGHLLEHGHCKLAFIEVTPLDSSNRKYVGCVAVAGAMPRVNCRNNPNHLAEIEKMIKSNGITGIVASDDMLAARLMAYFQTTGRRIPKDLTITGYGGYAFVAALMPHLTTVIFPAPELAREAARLLCEKIEGGILNRTKNTVLVEPRFYIGGSCGCAQKPITIILGNNNIPGSIDELTEFQ